MLKLNHLHVSCHRDLRVVESTTCKMEDSWKHGSKCYFGNLLCRTNLPSFYLLTTEKYHVIRLKVIAVPIKHAHLR